jgi:CobQ-like glutamine amidotransferase family enzyme
LARNPELADVLLGWALGGDHLEPLDDAAAEDLRAERLGATRRRRRLRRHAPAPQRQNDRIV